MTDIDTATAMERLVAFVNTLDVELGTDEIGAPAQLETWLRKQQLLEPGARAGGGDVEVAQQLREGLRRAMLAHDSHGPGGDATEAAVAMVPLQLVVAADGGVMLRPAGGGVPGALAQLVAPLPAAVADGSWERVKACPKDTCQWAFIDRSRNRSRRWCTMEVCGNREKTRTFRERQREADG